MASAFKQLIVKLAQTAGIEAPVRIVFNPASALRKLGWFRSVKEAKSVDLDWKSLPWLTYPAIAFLAERLGGDQVVFEYGLGGSSLWFAERAKSVCSVEHHREWYDKFAKALPSNAEVVFSPLGRDGDYLDVAFGETVARNAYTDTILSAPKADVVMIDGIYRNGCAAACEVIGPTGVIVFDNTDFPAAQPGVRYLRDLGWRQLRFVGMAPIFDKLCETSMFYRDGNCWKI
jgi:hypothetical protein